MPRPYLIFGDIEGKLDVLRVECTKCDRKARYPVHWLEEPSQSSSSGTQLLSIEGPEDFEEDPITSAVIVGGDRLAAEA